MSNAGIFGFKEEGWGEIHNGIVHVVKNHERSARDAAVPPGQAIEFEFYVAQFPFHMVVAHSDDDIGTTERRIPGREVGPLIRQLQRESAAAAITIARRRPLDILDFNGGMLEPPVPDPPQDRVVPFEITLTPPNGLAPLVYTNPSASTISRWPSDTMRIDPTYIERGKGRWTISVRNTNPIARRMYVHVQSVHALTDIRHKDIPLSLLNRLSAVALSKALPTIEYDRGNVIVSTPTQFLDLMGVDRTFSLGSIAAKLIDKLPTFTPCWAKVLSRADFAARIEQRIAALVVEYQALAQRHGPSMQARQLKALEKCQVSLSRLQNLPAAQAAYCIVLEGMFTDPDVDIRVIGTVAEIDNRIPQIGLVFDEEFKLTAVITNLAIDLSPLLAKTLLATGAVVALSTLANPVLGLFALIGGAALYNSIDDFDVEEEIRSKLDDKKDEISAYVKRALERITDLGASGLHARIHPGAAADGSDNLHIQYFNPSDARPPRPRPPGTIGTFGGAAETMVLTRGEVVARTTRAVTNVVYRSPEGAPVSAEREMALAREAPGPLPAGFVVPAPETLERLDNHDCIAILMMENRSYDHFFHDLPLEHPDKDYAKPPAGYRNIAPPGFKYPFSVVRNTNIGIGNNLIFGPGGRSTDPNHNYEHTLFQIGGGTEETKGSGEMKGFVADLARESDSPQIAISYFGMEDLPVYCALANWYPVCDRWFAALPVGTYPNRLASLQGNVPFLFNIHMDDPSLGYIEDYSIFDLMDTQGISWKFFESDIGTLRLYDRYRLNISHVRPIHELDATLRAARQGGALPRVMFIEPQFLFGNDDHPPMDVQQGQKFIRQVIGKFIEYGQLHRTLFVITYDEHGGFFDHVPPPGTPAAAQFGDPIADVGVREYGPIESLYTREPAAGDGDYIDPPTCLGVRVPSLVLSKYASPRANHTVLDHTAILKTLLLHNRNRISTEQFARFGERVMKRNHLGQVLDLQSPRPLDYPALSAEIGYRNSWLDSLTPCVVTARAAGLTATHPANVLRGIALPRGRIVSGS